MSTTTERHVRITLEATARPLAHAPANLLRVQLQSGWVIVLDTTGAGVTVEDVTPPRTWTPNDVVAGTGTVYLRLRDGWRGMSCSGHPVSATDGEMTDAVDVTKHGNDAMTVLRYQAGGDQ